MTPAPRSSGFLLGVFTLLVLVWIASPLAAPAEAAPALELPWPSSAQHRINGGYTYGCGTHVGSNYYAIDFQFSIGESVTATAPGVVTTASKGFNGGAGNYLVVDHGAGYQSRYLHLRDDLDGGPWPPGSCGGVRAPPASSSAWPLSSPARPTWTAFWRGFP